MSRKAWLVLVMVLAVSLPALAQKITVTGTVSDPTGEPLIGASVFAQGTSIGVATDFDGNYSINVDPDAVLVFSYVGFNNKEVKVDGRTQIDVTLEENTVMLNEVVAIGYGTVKKSDATGSVATVKPSEIQAGLATSAQDLLVGASPGVVVTTNGSPQGSADIQIRGGASLAASNAPLIVIDGVPMITDGTTGGGNPLGLVSPENIESMTILKDASATAIYGSRASNGVIIITTKKGTSGKPQVSFTMNGYVNTPRKYLNMMNAGEFRQFIINEYGADSEQASALGKASTNWMKEAMRTTFSSDYSLSVGGQAGFLPYRVALSYTDNNGILKSSSMDRVTAAINLTPKFFDGLLQVSANVKGSYTKNDWESNTLGTCASMNPTIAPKDPNGSPLFSYWTTYIGGGLLAGPDTPGTAVNTTTAPMNPIAEIMGNISRGNIFHSVGNLQLDLKMPFLPDLRANLNLGYDYQHGMNYSYTEMFTPMAWNGGYEVVSPDGKMQVVKDGGTSAKKEHQTRTNLLLDFYLNYNKDIEAIRSALDVTAGYSWQKFHNTGHNFTYVKSVGDPANRKYVGVQSRPTYYYSTPYQLVSFFGRVNYTLLNRYLVTATVRWDGTSRFSKDHRWGTFPSVALGWKLLEESFMEGLRGTMTELKLRGGYGLTGQQDLPDVFFPYLPVYNVSTNLSGMYPSLTQNGGAGVLPITPGSYNADIKWEETATWNAGIDFGFLNNRITGSIDFYKRKTYDLLTFANYPAGSNLTNKGNINIGDLENIGVEFTLNTRPVVTRDWTWQSNINVAWNKNKITRLAEGADTQVGGISAGTGGTIQKHEVGYPAFSFFVYEQVYDKQGNPVEGCFVDRNGDGQINEADKYLYHSRDPKVTLTWSNTLNYKNWDFGFVLRSNIGNWMYNNTQASNVFKSSNAALPLSNLLADTFLFNRSSITTIMSDYFVQNASFVRCDNITLGYTWPSLLQDKMRLRLYGAVQNPFVITKYKGLDPEVFNGIDNGVYPIPLTVSFGVVATF
ncbi:MAG: TonB-dependent receptor [Muribaculaceae bacterium]|nr:TonB-dependent receptor [Muribaculaceae bacterium]